MSKDAIGTIFRGPKRLLGLVPPGLAIAILAGCTPSHNMSTFDTSGPVAKSQLDVFIVIFWVGLGVFILIMALLIYGSIRFRRREGDGDPPQIHGHTRLEIAWTAVPAIVLAIVAVPSIISIFDTANSPRTPEQGGLLVEVVGHQWWFEFNYPDLGVTTANELHIPVGEPINISLDSVDVIHSFWVPKLAGKVDMVPNNDNTMWLQADEPGEYFGQCAEFCGIAHAKMMFRVIAQPVAEFNAWIEAQKLPALEPTDPLAVKGRDVFMARETLCFRCHTIDGTRLARGVLGPDLTHFGSRGRFAGGTVENTQKNLREWLEDPCAVKPGNLMCEQAEVYIGTVPPLTEPEISALVAYLRGLK